MRPATAVSVLLLALSIGGLATSQMPTEFKLTPKDPGAADQFGYSVAVSGDTALVGAQLDDDAGDNSGSAYVFVRNGSVWTEQAKLTASDAAKEDRFGWSVSLSGDTAVIGARNDDDVALNSGSAYVFVRSGTSWSQQAKLTASDPGAGDGFGESVAVSGDTAVVGARHDDDGGLGSGSAYVFMRSGTTWAEQTKLTASDAARLDSFGSSAALSGNTAVVGAFGDDDAGSDTGSAYVFVRNGAMWTEQGKLTASDAFAGDRFGLSVAVHGDTAVVGAERDDDAGSSSGSAYVFVRSGTTWAEQTKLTASDAGGGDLFGVSVAVSGNTVLVGAHNDDDAGSASGSAYVYVRNSTIWTEQAKLTAHDAAPGEFFGFSVALSADTALVGASFGVGGAAVSGAAYVFRRDGTHWVQNPRVTEFEVGCAGTIGVPVLQSAVGSTPRIGGPFDVVLSNLPPNNRAFLILGLSNAKWLSMDLPLSLASFGAPDCNLLVSGDFFTGVVNTTGTANQGFLIPLDPSLVGLHIYFQGYVEDPGANFFGVAVSNGLEITVGSL